DGIRDRNVTGVQTCALQICGIEVVVGGTDADMVYDFENGFWEDEERDQVFEVQKEEYDGPIKVGFEIKTDLKTQLRELKEYKREIGRASCREEGEEKDMQKK